VLAGERRGGGQGGGVVTLGCSSSTSSTCERELKNGHCLWLNRGKRQLREHWKQTRSLLQPHNHATTRAPKRPKAAPTCAPTTRSSTHVQSPPSAASALPCECCRPSLTSRCLRARRTCHRPICRVARGRAGGRRCDTYAWVTCYMLHVTCYIPHVKCYMSHVTCVPRHARYHATKAPPGVGR